MMIARASLCRPLALVLAAGLALALSGCGGDDADKPARTIYLSVPQHGALTPRGDDMEDAVKLALEQTKYDTPVVRIELKIVDSGEDRQNLREAIADKSALAYIYFDDREAGGRGAGGAVAGGPIAADPILGISLAPIAGSGGSSARPELATIHLLPSSESSGAALAQAVAAEAPSRVTIYVGSTEFARAAAEGFKAAIADTPVKLVERKGATGVNAVPEPGRKTVYGADRPQAANPASEGVLVTPALPPAGYPPNGEKFFKWFDDAYGHVPDRWAIWAYEAAGLALNAATDAGEKTGDVTRESTRDAAFSITDRFGPVGHYDILPDGRSTIYTFSVRPWPIDAAAEAEDPGVIEVNR